MTSHFPRQKAKLLSAAVLLVLATLSLLTLSAKMTASRQYDEVFRPFGHNFLSTRSSHQILTNCDARLTLFSRDSPTSLEDARFCMNFAASNLRIRPRQAYAKLVEAKVHWYFGDDEAAFSALMESIAIQPHEAWLAERRILFLIDQLSPPDLFDQTIFWNDFQIALHRVQSHLVLARIIHDFPEQFADRQSSLIANLPRSTQASILSSLSKISSL